MFDERHRGGKMLSSLHVKNLALIEEEQVEFDEGLNIMTGETGAGKSIILGSINIALGGKVTAEIIRKNAEYALTELVFTVEDLDKINQLKQMDVADIPDVADIQNVENILNCEVIISRKITKTRSPIKVNGVTCTTSQVKKIASILIDIHGQHDNQLLLKESSHIDMIDLYEAKEIEDIKTNYLSCYKEYRDLCDKLDHMDMDEEARRREISFLEYEVEQITSANLVEGEDEELEAQYKKLSNSRNIMEELSRTNFILTEGETNVSDMLGQAVKSVVVLAEYDKEMEQLTEDLTNIEDLLGDVICSISDYARNCVYDPMEFEQISSRLDLINSLKLKYGKTISEILIYAERQQEKLLELNNYNDVVNNLREQIREKKAKLQKISEKLTKYRMKSAKGLCQSISEGLKELNFLNNQFETEFTAKENFTSNGCDDVKFMISTNIGEPIKPLSKVASGGELSRIMLAIKTVMAGKEGTQTLIFDEIDAGISGRTAQMVAKKLKCLSKNHQIICITHLPQIAAMASTHFMIEKNVVDNHTTTSITKLEEDTSIMELARLLGGSQVTETVVSNAREMKNLARLND